MFDGFEVDMTSLGNADSILLTQWNANTPTRILVDGGNKGDYPTVRNRLTALEITHLDAVVNTHPHDDHAGGLVPLLADQTLTIGQLYMHVPHWHVDAAKVKKAIAEAAGLRETVQIEKSMQTVNNLWRAAKARDIPVSEVFAGQDIFFMKVVGPSREYYEELVKEFEDPERIRTVSENEDAWDTEREKIEKGEISESLLDSPETTPENDSSILLATIQKKKTFLLTADAGVPALQNAADSFELENLAWMQIPHHGSRHNIDCALIDHFNPSQAWVSARGSKKHPRRSVINAFKNKGAKVYSTHYPSGGSIHYAVGNVPVRNGYISATPLWDKGTL
jgi:beta-lactamase superfamily II metal-dependent hydrolase